MHCSKTLISEPFTFIVKIYH